MHISPHLCSQNVEFLSAKPGPVFTDKFLFAWRCSPWDVFGEMACFRFNFNFTCFTGIGNSVHQNHNMCIGFFFFYWLGHPLFLCLWEANLVPGLTSTWPRLYNCLLSSTVCIVIECCELCTCHQAFVWKMLKLWAVLQIFRVIHL